MEKLHAYYQLTKPGIIKGNSVHVLVGVLLASKFMVDVSSALGVVVGTSLVIASACIVNNYIDRHIDAKMKRTKNRATVTGFVSARGAMTVAAALAAVGFGVLIVTTNLLVLLIGIAAYVMYVWVYGYVKRRSVLSTVVGAIPGALPAMAGYVAVSGELSTDAWLVFLLVFVWQLPHFYAISVFRKKEYSVASIPVLAVVAPFTTVYNYILGSILVYLLVIILMIMSDTIGTASGLLLLAGAGFWIGVCMMTSTSNEVKWAKSVFGASLVLTLVLLVASLINVFVPPVA